MKPGILSKTKDSDIAFTDGHDIKSIDKPDSDLRKEYDTLLARAVSNSLNMKQKARLMEILGK